MGNRMLTDSLSSPLGGATTAKVTIETDAGNLTIDRLTGGEPLLASGTLQYLASQDAPTCAVTSENGQATLTVRGHSNPWFGIRLPWSACNGAFEWQIHLNPTVSSDITARSGGGNLKLNLAGMILTHLMADAGGGNVDVILPENAANLNAGARTGAGNVTVEIGRGMAGRSTVDASSGAGNVVVRVPGDVAARIHVTSGLGKVIMDPRFSPLDRKTFQSPDYDNAADKVEITVNSGAGSVTIKTNQ